MLGLVRITHGCDKMQGSSDMESSILGTIISDVTSVGIFLDVGRGDVGCSVILGLLL